MPSDERIPRDTRRQTGASAPPAAKTAQPRGSSGLRVVPSADDLAYQRLMVIVEAARGRAAALQTELESLRDELGRFEIAYQAQTGYLLVELNRLRLACDELRQRIALLHEQPTTSADAVDDAIERLFRQRRQGLDNDAEEARRYQRAEADQRDQPALDPETEAELRQTYRALARRHHPDLVQDPAERERRERQMSRINAAYRDRDLETLRTLLTTDAADDAESGGRDSRERVVWAEAEVRRLDAVVAGLTGELARIRGTATWHLWQRAQREPDLLHDLAAQIASQIDEARDRLTDLTTRFETLRGITRQGNPAASPPMQG